MSLSTSQTRWHMHHQTQSVIILGKWNVQWLCHSNKVWTDRNSACSIMFKRWRGQTTGQLTRSHQRQAVAMAISSHSHSLSTCFVLGFFIIFRLCVYAAIQWQCDQPIDWVIPNLICGIMSSVHCLENTTDQLGKIGNFCCSLKTEDDTSSYEFGTIRAENKSAWKHAYQKLLRHYPDYKVLG